ncbi:MAG: hypothetical protein DELT_02674 [Desulfovibrio sp.]
MSTLTQDFAAWSEAVSWETLPEAVREKTRACLLDWLAAVSSGAAHPAAATYVALARELGGTQGVSIAARTETTSKAFAIFANGALGHITENDDGHRWSIMHPGDVVFPVVAVLAPLAANPAKAAVEGAVVGYEAAIRLGVALGPDHYSTWHTTATAGVFGAAAAAAKILELGEHGMADALGHAGTQAAGLWQFLDDGCVAAKPFHPGKSCLSGYIAAVTAKNGIPGAAHILEGSKGVLAALGRPPMPEKFAANLGNGYAILEANFKGYPTCGQTHSMIDALARIMKEHGISAADVASIEARVYAKAITVAGNLNPQNLEEAKFSIPFCLAYMLLHGRIPFTGITGDDVFRDDIRAVMGKVSLVEDAAMTAGFPDARPCRVIVTTTDGRRLDAENTFRKGDPENPMTFDEIADKFRELGAGVYSPIKRETVITTVRNMCRDENAGTWPDIVPDMQP